eukprot:487056_1
MGNLMIYLKHFCQMNNKRCCWTMSILSFLLLLSIFYVYIPLESAVKIYNTESLHPIVNSPLKQPIWVSNKSSNNLQPKSCLLLWYTKTKQCQVGGFKAMIKNMISHGILEAVYRNCTYLILDKYFKLTHKHEIHKENVPIHQHYSYWDFFDIPNIEIININNNKSIPLRILSSEYFKTTLRHSLNIPKHVITKKDVFEC